MRNHFFIRFIVIMSLSLLFFSNCKEEVDSSVQKRLKVAVTNGDNNRIKPDEVFERNLMEKIPKGTLLRFSGNGEMTIKPGVEENRGLFFSFAVKTRDEKNVKTSILLKRNDKYKLLEKFDKKNYYRKFSREISFLKNDEVIIRTRGEGTIIVNKPLLYKIIPKEKRKYIFVVALDTLRYDSIGIKRNGISLTPTIDKLRSDSVEFSNTYTQSSWTLASFTSFFTGLYEFNHQVTRVTSIENTKPFLIEQLREKFFTVNFNSGLWLRGKFGFSRGFDQFAIVSNPTDGYGGRALFNATIDVVENTRFPSLFMFLHTYQIHSPYTPPEKYIDQLQLKVKKKKLDTYFYNKQYLKDFDQSLPGEMKKLYEAEIFAFDDFFSRFINRLKEKGIYDQSMIVFYTDHGEEFYEHKAWSHAHSLYNEIIKSPLFIKFPNNKYKGKVIDENVALIDILPTLMDYTKVSKAKNIDGVSLMPLIEDKKIDRKNIYSSTSVTWLVKQIAPKFAIIQGDYKIIYNYPFSEENNLFFSKYGLPPEVDEIQIFNMKTDPKELSEIRGKKKAQMKKEFFNDIKRLKKKIDQGMEKKRKSNVNFSKEEKKKLESLGYITAAN